jgi:hypothetical protein
VTKNWQPKFLGLLENFPPKPWWYHQSPNKPTITHASKVNLPTSFWQGYMEDHSFSDNVDMAHIFQWIIRGLRHPSPIQKHTMARTNLFLINI